MSKNNNWQDILGKSEAQRVKGEGFKKKAGELLWDGAKGAIESWDVAADTSAEGLALDVMAALGGTHRKGDASKVKTVALAVSGKGLDVGEYGSLSKAYAAARALLVTAKVEADEDTAAEAAVEEIEAPKTASTVEAAAKIVLSKGVETGVAALLDALGADNDAAHRSFARALATEVTKRIGDRKAAEQAETKAKRDAERAAAKEKAAAAIAERKAEKAAKAAAAKAEKAAAAKAAKPAKAEKGEPAKAAPAKAAPAKAAPAKAAPAKAAPAKAAPAKAAPAKAAPVKRATPVKRG